MPSSQLRRHEDHLLSSTTTTTAATNTNDNTIPRPRVPWGDVNVLMVTDIHSWIGGHGRHSERSTNNSSGAVLDANYGHVVSFYQRLQEYAQNSGKDFFFVMNGDFMDGTGLTEYPPVHLLPLLEHMPWDAINIGNHELYHDSTIELMQTSGFIDRWQGRYLTSNVISSSTLLPLGQRFKVLHGNKSSVLTFGFLYNFTNYCKSTIVEPVQQVVQQEWFQHALMGNFGDYNAILVLAHMDYLDPLVVDVLLPAMRNFVGPDMPIQFITGHSHIRGFSVLDSTSTTLEAGRYLDTVGFCSFPIQSTVQALQANQIATVTSDLFRHVLIDANQETLRNVAQVPTLMTPGGRALSNQIHETQQSLGLFQVLGCAPTTYHLDYGLDDPHSLWGLYMNQIIPQVLFSGKVTNSTARSIFVQGTGGLRYDLLQGTVTLDDVVSVCPYRDIVYKLLEGVRGDVLIQILGGPTSINAVPKTSITIGRFNTRLPRFAVAGEVIVADRTYDFMVVNFDLPYFLQRIENVTGNNATQVTPVIHVPTGDVVTTTQLWIDFVQRNWLTPKLCNGASQPSTARSDTWPEILGCNSVLFWSLGLISGPLLVFVTWRVLFVVVWRRRQGYTVPAEVPEGNWCFKQQPSPPPLGGTIKSQCHEKGIGQIEGSIVNWSP